MVTDPAPVSRKVQEQVNDLAQFLARYLRWALEEIEVKVKRVQWGAGQGI